MKTVIALCLLSLLAGHTSGDTTVTCQGRATTSGCDASLCNVICSDGKEEHVDCQGKRSSLSTSLDENGNTIITVKCGGKPISFSGDGQNQPCFPFCGNDNNGNTANIGGGPNINQPNGVSGQNNNQDNGQNNAANDDDNYEDDDDDDGIAQNLESGNGQNNNQPNGANGQNNDQPNGANGQNNDKPNGANGLNNDQPNGANGQNNDQPNGANGQNNDQFNMGNSPSSSQSEDKTVICTGSSVTSSGCEGSLCKVICSDESEESVNCQGRGASLDLSLDGNGNTIVAVKCAGEANPPCFPFCK